MPPIVLTTLKFFFIALLYLFIARAIRVIHLDLVGARVPKPKARRTPKRGHPRSIEVNEPEKAARTLALKEEEISFGRAQTCTVPLDDTYVSTLHARLFSKDGQWFVEDLGSTNGTYLNRVKVTGPAPLTVGDQVRVGKTLVEVRKS
jgi:pSer/pThr/pTyr-binding forkhead associated (FHA) protein